MIDAAILRRPTASDGLRAIPESWIPSGAHRATVQTSYGSDHATISRDAEEVVVDCDNRWSPDVTIRSIDDQRVRVRVDMPFPLPDIEARGPLHLEDGVAHLDDDLSDRSADMWRMYDGRVAMVVHQPGKDDIDVLLTIDPTRTP